MFSTASFPMQQADRLGPGRLVRCPRCARLRSAVPVGAVSVSTAATGPASIGAAPAGVEQTR
ncbi:hypothetical protein ABZX85_34395 [Streptomyces sp. NPDC004539]|uniref:hypothetical protein n=1 Tax=Streptomyces sp. NPDC004539 TaxID=3154280 RepID=UPI0033AB635D